jgi:hypothetical protein
LLALLTLLPFLLLNLTARGYALHATGSSTWDVFLVMVAVGAVLCLLLSGGLALAFLLFGTSFFLYGFHALPARWRHEWLLLGSQQSYLVPERTNALATPATWATEPPTLAPKPSVGFRYRQRHADASVIGRNVRRPSLRALSQLATNAPMPEAKPHTTRSAERARSRTPRARGAHPPPGARA